MTARASVPAAAKVKPDCPVCEDDHVLSASGGPVPAFLVDCPACRPELARTATLTPAQRRILEAILSTRGIIAPWPTTLPSAVSPGTEPGPGANVADALVTLGIFMAQIAGVKPDIIRSYERAFAFDDAGRWAMMLHGLNARCIVAMPGHTIWQVRPAGRSPWDFPRVIVDGIHCLWDEAAARAFHALSKGR